MTTPLAFDDVVIEAGSAGARVLAFGPRTILAFNDVDTTFTGLYVGRVDGHVYLGFSSVGAEFDGEGELPSEVGLMFDDVAIASGLTPPKFKGRYCLRFDSVDAVSGAIEGYLPDFSDNLPIQMAVVLSGTMKVFPPAGS